MEAVELKLFRLFFSLFSYWIMDSSSYTLQMISSWKLLLVAIISCSPCSMFHFIVTQSNDKVVLKCESMQTVFVIERWKIRRNTSSLPSSVLVGERLNGMSGVEEQMHNWNILQVCTRLFYWYHFRTLLSPCAHGVYLWETRGGGKVLRWLI